MGLPRCPHSVYSPAGNGKPSEYCSGCTVPAPLPDGLKKEDIITTPLPHGDNRCPKCGSKKFKYKNNWDFRCSNCGFNALE